MVYKIAIIGSGSYGQGLGASFSDPDIALDNSPLDRRVLFWNHNLARTEKLRHVQKNGEKALDQLRKEGDLSVHHNWGKDGLKDRVEFYAPQNMQYPEKSVDEVLSQEPDVIIIAVDSQHHRQVAQLISPYIIPGTPVINGTKGASTDEDANYIKITFPYTNMVDFFEKVPKFSMSGLNVVDDILGGVPQRLSLYPAIKSRKPGEKYKKDIAQSISDNLDTKNLTISGSRFLNTYQVAHILKPIIAGASGILAGYQDARGMRRYDNDNVRGAMIGYFIKSTLPFVSALGGTPLIVYMDESLHQDLRYTAHSQRSRNYRFGKNLAKGMNLEESLNDVGETVELIPQLKLANAIVAANPELDKGSFIPQMHEIVFNSGNIGEIVQGLFKKRDFAPEEGLSMLKIMSRNLLSDIRGHSYPIWLEKASGKIYLGHKPNS